MAPTQGRTDYMTGKTYCRNLVLLAVFLLTGIGMARASDTVQLFQVRPVSGEFAVRDSLTMRAKTSGPSVYFCNSRGEWHLGARYDWSATAVGIDDEEKYR